MIISFLVLFAQLTQGRLSLLNVGSFPSTVTSPGLVLSDNTILFGFQGNYILRYDCDGTTIFGRYVANSINNWNSILSIQSVGSSIYASSSDGNIYQWDVDAMTVSNTLSLPPVSSFLATTNTLVVGLTNGSINSYTLNFQYIWSVPYDLFIANGTLRNLTTNPTYPLSMVYSPSNFLLLTLNNFEVKGYGSVTAWSFLGYGMPQVLNTLNTTILMAGLPSNSAGYRSSLIAATTKKIFVCSTGLGGHLRTFSTSLSMLNDIRLSRNFMLTACGDLAFDNSGSFYFTADGGAISQRDQSSDALIDTNSAVTGSNLLMLWNNTMLVFSIGSNQWKLLSFDVDQAYYTPCSAHGISAITVTLISGGSAVGAIAIGFIGWKVAKKKDVNSKIPSVNQLIGH